MESSHGLEEDTPFENVQRMDKRRQLHQFLKVCMALSTTLMIWKGLIVVTECESPLLVLNTGMVPAFDRGDLLFLTNFREEPVRVGDIVVFKVPGRPIPIVHRVVKLHEKHDGTAKFLTRADNNIVYDQDLSAPGQFWLTKNDLIGKARGVLPYAGMMAIMMNEYPNLVIIVLGALAVRGLLYRE